MKIIVIDCWQHKNVMTLKIGDEVYLKKDKTKFYTIVNCNEKIKSGNGSFWKEYSVDLINKDNNKISKYWWKWTDYYEDIPIRLRDKNAII